MEPSKEPETSMRSSYEIFAVQFQLKCFKISLGQIAIGRFIFPDFYRTPGDNKIVPSTISLFSGIETKVSACQQSRPRRAANCRVCVICQGEIRKSPYSCRTNYVYYPSSVLAFVSRRCLHLCVRPYFNHELVHILSKSPHSNYMYEQYQPFNHRGRKRVDFSQTFTYSNAYLDGNLFNLDRNLLKFIPKGPIDHK